jgi:short-subunit dehydrogenase
MATKPSRDLHGKVVVITGASSGFGRGAAVEFARAGAAVVLAARRDDELDEVARECEAEGAFAVPVPTDVSVESDVEALAREAVAKCGRIDVWVNNAGVGALGKFQDIPLEEHEQVIRTDLLGTLYGSYFAYRQFLKQGEGTLINIASELGKTTVPYYTSYTAAKHGVVGLSDSLRQEIQQDHIDGVHVCTILPTAHDTPFFDHAANYTGRKVTAPKPLHDPKNVVDAILKVARRPDDEKIVGADGVLKVAMANLAPGLSEKAGAKMMHKTQYEDAPPSADSPGAVQQPVPHGTQVSAGRRKKKS